MRENNRALNLMCAAVVLAASGYAFASDPIPYFRPDPKPVMYGPDLPDPMATECSARDAACIRGHDYRLLSTALKVHDRALCFKATDEARCLAVYDMVEGDVVIPLNPVLADPCAQVLLVDGGRAKVSSSKLGVVRWVLNRGYKAGTHVGNCQTQAALEVKVPLPEWKPMPRSAP